MITLYVCGIVTIVVGIGLVYFGWDYLKCSDIMSFTPLNFMAMIALGFALIYVGWIVLPFDLDINFRTIPIK